MLLRTELFADEAKLQGILMLLTIEDQCGLFFSYHALRTTLIDVRMVEALLVDAPTSVYDSCQRCAHFICSEVYLRLLVVLFVLTGVRC